MVPIWRRGCTARTRWMRPAPALSWRRRSWPSRARSFRASRLALDVFHDHLLLDLGDIDRALAVGPESCPAAGGTGIGIGIGVGNEIRHHAVLQAADAHAAPPARMM